MTIFKLPTLYKRDKLNRLRWWSVWTDKETLYRHDGIVDGETIKEVTKKTVKANTLRTASEQAIQEAKKEWLKKVDQGFEVDDKDTAGIQLYNSIISQKQASKTDTNVGLIFNSVENIDSKKSKKVTVKKQKKIPIMLAKNFYASSSNAIVSPFIEKFFLNKQVGLQPKLDGVRCIASYEAPNTANPTGIVHLKSRNNKEFMYLDHIRESLKKNIFKKYPDVILDGEIYYHNPKIDSVTRYQFVSSVAKISRLKPHEEESKVEYWVFDMIPKEDESSGDGVSFIDRYKFLLQKLFKKDIPHIVLTPTRFKESETVKELEKSLLTLYEHYTDDLSFEGVMLKDGEAPYKDGRQSSLVKFKLFSDEDWIIVDAKRSEGGNQDGAVVWVLKDPTDKTKVIEAKQIGDVETSKELYLNKNNYIGKRINIRFNEKTQDGLPRFPRAISFVEDKN